MYPISPRRTPTSRLHQGTDREAAKGTGQHHWNGCARGHRSRWRQATAQDKCSGQEEAVPFPEGTVGKDQRRWPISQVRTEKEIYHERRRQGRNQQGGQRPLGQDQGSAEEIACRWTRLRPLEGKVSHRQASKALKMA